MIKQTNTRRNDRPSRLATAAISGILSGLTRAVIAALLHYLSTSN